MSSVFWVLCSEIVVLVVSWVDTDGLNGLIAVTSSCDDFAATSADNQVIFRIGSDNVVAGEVFEDLELTIFSNYKIMA